MACFVVSAAAGVGVAIARHAVKHSEKKKENAGIAPKIEKFGSVQVVLLVKNLPANAENTRDTGSVHGPGSSSGEGHVSILAWRIPGTEEPSGL